MDCVNARKILIRKDIEEYAAREVANAEQHVSACQVCQEYLQFNERLQQLLHKKLSGVVTPPAIRESLLDQLAAMKRPSQKPERSVKKQRLLWAAALTVIVVGGLLFLAKLNDAREDTAHELASLLIQDHIEIQLRENPLDIETSDKRQLEQWFTKRVDFAVNVPTIQNASLRGGRLCYLLKKRVAFIVFEREAKPISAYLLDGGGIDLPALDQLSSSDGRSFYRDSDHGYNAVLWKSGGLIYAFVSSIDCAELERLAARL